MANKILFISYDGLSDPLGQSQIIPYLSGLSDHGYDITILSCEKKKILVKEKERIKENLSKKGIGWRYIYFRKRPPLFSAMYNLFLLKRKALSLHKKKEFAIIHCRSYIAALIGLKIKKKFGVKFIFDMRGFWADERVEGGLWNLKNPIYKLVYNYFKRKEIAFIANADYVIALTEKSKQIIHSWENIPGQPVQIQVIPCCVDIHRFSKENINNEELNMLKKNLGIDENDFIMSYLGSMGTWYCLDEMLAFFSRLLKAKPNAKFLFITQNEPEIIFSASIKHKIPFKKLIIHAAHYYQVPAYLALSHISIFFIKPSFSKNASSPTKQAETLSMGIPIICNAGIGDSKEILHGKCGIVINKFQEDEYDRAITDMEVFLSMPPDKIRYYATTLFSLEKGIEKFNSVYAALLNTGRGIP